jgi:hypothetical protein
MNLSGFWSWLAPILKPFVEAVIQQLVSEEAAFLAAFNALESKTEPEVLAFVTTWVDKIPVSGFIGQLFSGEVKSLVVGYIASELSSLVAQGQSLEAPALAGLVADLEKAAQSVGL